MSREAIIDGNRLTLVADGTHRLSALLAMIAGARTRLDLYYYIFAADACAKQVRDALIAACDRGVAVTLMIDAFGSGATPDGFFAPLIESGARFGRFGFRRSTRYLIRNHQKMTIADGNCALIGGFNIEDGYFAAHEDRNAWCDLALLMEGPGVAPLQHWFDGMANWVLESPQRFRALRRLIREWHPQSSRVQWLMGGPTRRLSGWARCVKGDLQQGQRLDLIAAYFSPGRSMLRRIMRLARRQGARVILPVQSDNTATIGAARHLYRRMLSRGVELHEYGQCKLHMKLIVIDDIVYIGSANFDMRSLFLNVEIMLRVQDAGFAVQARELVARMEEGSRRIDGPTYRVMAGPVARLRWLVSYLLVGVLDYTVTRRLNFRSEPR